MNQLSHHMLFIIHINLINTRRSFYNNKFLNCLKSYKILINILISILINIFENTKIIYFFIIVTNIYELFINVEIHSSIYGDEFETAIWAND